MDLKEHIRAVPDFPKPGILFYDISTMLAHPDAWQVALGRLARIVSKHQPDMLAGIESRGFLVAAPLAAKLGLGFCMATGGTLGASLELFDKVGAKVVGAACIIELTFLGGRDKIGVPFDALISYDE